MTMMMNDDMHLNFNRFLLLYIQFNNNNNNNNYSFLINNVNYVQFIIHYYRIKRK